MSVSLRKGIIMKLHSVNNYHLKSVQNYKSNPNNLKNNNSKTVSFGMDLDDMEGCAIWALGLIGLPAVLTVGIVRGCNAEKDFQANVNSFYNKTVTDISQQNTGLDFSFIQNPLIKEEISHIQSENDKALIRMKKSVVEKYPFNRGAIIANWDRVNNLPIQKRIEIIDALDAKYPQGHAMENVKEDIAKVMINMEYLQAISRSEKLFSQFAQQANNLSEAEVKGFLDNIVFLSKTKDLIETSKRDFLAFKDNVRYLKNSNQEVRQRIIDNFPKNYEQVQMAFHSINDIDLRNVDLANLTKKPTNKDEEKFFGAIKEIRTFTTNIQYVKNSYENYYKFLDAFYKVRNKINNDIANLNKNKAEQNISINFDEMLEFSKIIGTLNNGLSKMDNINFEQFNPLSIKPDFYKSKFTSITTNNERDLAKVFALQVEAGNNLNKLIKIYNRYAQKYDTEMKIAKQKGAEENSGWSILELYGAYKLLF